MKPVQPLLVLEALPSEAGPGLAARLMLVDAFSDAHITVQVEGISPDSHDPSVPCLLVYGGPDLMQGYGLQDFSAATEVCRRLADLVDQFQVLTHPPPLRLVNLSLAPLPQLVSWVVALLAQAEPPSAPPQTGPSPLLEPDGWFRPQPDPIDALIGLVLLRAELAFIDAYRRLELHPLAASADRRLPDHDVEQRLERSATPERLVEVRSLEAGLADDLDRLAAELGAARSALVDGSWMRPQLARSSQQRCEELESCSEQERARLKGELDALHSRHRELSANYVQVQASLEQAVRSSRAQRELLAMLAGTFRGLQRQMSRLRCG